MTRRLSYVMIAMLAVAGCGSSSSMTGTGGNGSGGGSGNNGGGTGGTGGGGTGGGGGGGGSGGTGGSGGGGGGMSGPLVPPGTTIGTFIVLGDSISDRGGQGPFFYDQLNADFTKKWPGLMYVHAAQAGAITDNFSDNTPPASPTLKNQVTGLGKSYPGDVLITITIGGNDLNAHAIKAIGGTDDAVRTEFGQHLDAELGELATAGRLGSGHVYIVLANIYDFSDGMGDFATIKCGPGANVMASRDMAVFNAWNGLSAAAVQKVGGALYDMHADFNGHGYNNMNAGDVWYYKNGADCIHPNTAGHNEIRRSIYKIVTGEDVQ